jgi:hypothetical protein
MANVTASMSVPANVLANQPFVITMTLANSSGTAVTISNIIPSLSPLGGSTSQACSYGMGAPPLGPNNPNSIPATGTLVMTFPCVIYAPQPPSNVDLATPAQFQYSLQATVITNDATPTIYAAPLGITVSSFIKASDTLQGYPTPPNTNPGGGVFSVPGNSGVLLLVGM